MSTTTPSQAPQDSNARAQSQLIHAVSLCAVALCPIVLALPPRKLDAYSVLLVSGTFVGSNQLAQEYTGRSILTRIQAIPQNRWQRGVTIKEGQTEGEKMVEQGVLARLTSGKQNRSGDGVLKGRFYKDAEPFIEEKGELGTRILGEIDKKKKEEEETTTRKWWMGGDESNWKKDRDRREKEALEEGKGYGDMITEQIWEVWNWGREKTEEVKKSDEKAVKKEKGGKEGKR